MKYVQARDAGVYECQVGTEPKMSHFVQLNVVGKLFVINLLFIRQDNEEDSYAPGDKVDNFEDHRLQKILY